MLPPTPVLQCSPLLPLLALSMRRGVLPARDPTHRGRNHPEHSKLQGLRTTLDSGLRHQPRAASIRPTAVCCALPFNLTSILTRGSHQQNPPILDPRPAKVPSKTKLAQMHASTTRLEHELRQRQAASARIWTDVRPRPSKQRRAKAGTQRPRLPRSLHSQTTINPVRGQLGVPTLRPGATPRRASFKPPLSPLTRSLSMRLTMRMRRASPATATAMRSALARWLLVTMMPARASGSICPVWD